MSKSRNSSDRESVDSEDFKKKFGELPLDQKVATLMQLEATTMSEAVNKIVDKSISASETVMDKLTERMRGSKDSKKSK